MLTWAQALAALLLAVACALLSALEVVWQAAAPARGEAAGSALGGRGGRSLGAEHLGRALSAIRLVRLVLHGLLAAGLGDLASARLGPAGPVAAALAAAGLVAVTSLLPVMAAKRHRRALAAALSGWAWGLAAAFRPLQAPWGLLQRRAAATLGLERGQALPFWTPSELAQLGETAHAESLGGRGAELFRSLVDFRGTIIREIMVPRTEVAAVARDVDYRQLRGVLRAAGHSRLPVYDDTIDHVVGLLHVKDLLAAEWASDSTGPQAAWQELMRPTFYVPEVMKISELLREFQRRKTHMAIVVDEYGGTSGVVTLEDIIEEIVGEIHDEYDVEEKQYRRVGDKIVADGRVNLWDLEAPLGLRFPSDGAYETLAGFLTARHGSIPRRGLSVAFGGWSFLIKEASDKRVEVVEIAAVPPAR